MTECTSGHCNQPANKFICADCINELQTELNKIPDLMGELFTTMAKLDKTAPQRHEGGGGLSTGSAMPIRHGALEMRTALAFWNHQDAETLANDEHAGKYKTVLDELIQDAMDLIDNPEEIRVITTCTCGGKVTSTQPKPEDGDPDEGDCEECGNHYQQTEAMTRFRINLATPKHLQTRRALKWIREHANLSIKSTDVRNWAREGKLTATNPERGKREHPTYNVADILTIHYRHVEGNKRATKF